MAEPQYPDFVFPLGGISRVGEQGQQKPGTTQTGVNVRSLDPHVRRLRGASRCGLSKFVPDQADGTSTLIQHLNVIVDPTTAAMLVNFTDPPIGSPPPPPGSPDPFQVPDPPTSGPTDPDDPNYRGPPDKAEPPGGNGWTPWPTVPPDSGGGEPDVPTVIFRHVDETGGDVTEYDASHSFGTVSGGSFLCVFVFSANFYDDTITTLQDPTVSQFQDTLGLTWTERATDFGGASSFVPLASNGSRGWLYTAKVGATGGTCTVSWKFSYGHGDRGAAYQVILWEVSGLASSDPFVDGAVTTENFSFSVHPYLEMTDSVTPDNNSNVVLVCGVISGATDNATFTQVSPTGMDVELVELQNPPGPPVNGTYGLLYSIQDRASGVAITAKVGMADPDNVTSGYGMAAVVLRKN